MNRDLLSQLPGVDAVLLVASSLVNRFGHQQVSGTIRRELDKLRQEILSGNRNDLPAESTLVANIEQQLARLHSHSLKPVFNLTGTVLHTNLGRAQLPGAAIEAVGEIALGFSNLEFDLDNNQRGDRDSHIEDLIIEITGAEAATVVNNNAAAVLLTLSAMASGKEVPVSRGELVEIGGSFRIPDIMAQSGCQLIEIGATNRTHEKDYIAAINANTALLLKVHTSNYEIQGFTQSVLDADVAKIARQHKLPFVTDLGSGTLVDLSKWGLPYEPTVQQTIVDGADIVTFSGDKLLGGPQCGLIVGKREYIQQIKSHPLKRALRVDKMTLAALYQVLRLYLQPDTLNESLPTLRYLTRTESDIRQQADQLQPIVQEKLGAEVSVETTACSSQIGSGALPTNLLPGAGLKLTPAARTDRALTNLAAQLRQLPIPVIGRIHDGSLYLDLRTLETTDEFLSQLDLLNL